MNTFTLKNIDQKLANYQSSTCRAIKFQALLITVKLHIKVHGPVIENLTNVALLLLERDN